MKIRDVRGAVQLAADAVVGVTGVVEGMHSRIADLLPTLGRTPDKPARGISGLVYRAVRATTRLTHGALDLSLAAGERLQGEAAAADGPQAQDAPARLALLAALNGLVGDHLERTGNPLAQPMHLRAVAPPGDRLLVLVHGLCMHDLQWRRHGHDHGAALARQAGWSPVYLRYNTGRHISTNGLQFAQALEQLVQAWPVPVRSIAIVGHSMGGLVARSAVHQAQAAGLQWRGRLHHLACLGTPHHGALLERGGNWLHAALEVSPYAASLARLAAVRSDGITDLRFGNLLDADWAAGRHGHADTRTAVPLPADVRCYAVAGTLATPVGRAPLGDGLVTVDSALGRHRRAAMALHFDPAHVLTVPDAGHLDLLSDARVARQLCAWLAPGAPGDAAAGGQ